MLGSSSTVSIQWWGISRVLPSLNLKRTGRWDQGARPIVRRLGLGYADLFTLLSRLCGTNIGPLEPTIRLTPLG